jgi:hypothetical protein
VKRVIVLLAGLAMSPLVGWMPPAGALGVAPCVITGTITFTPPAGAAAQGEWRIGPAAINCVGTYRGPERYTGQGPFIGWGSYTALPTGGGECLRQVGKGTVQYTLVTSVGPFTFTEPQEFLLAGAGKFTTPTMRGSFVPSPPYEGDCVSKPMTRFTFFAQAMMLRDVPAELNPGASGTPSP